MNLKRSQKPHNHIDHNKGQEDGTMTRAAAAQSVREYRAEAREARARGQRMESEHEIREACRLAVCLLVGIRERGKA